MDTVITRTLGSGAATTKFTYSTWVKRTALGVYGRFFTSNGTGDSYFRFDTNDYIEISGDSSSAVSAGYIITNRKFRDLGAWYHIVVRFDSSESLANDRLRLYINGVNERDVGGYSTDTMPNSAVDDNINLSGNVHRIGGTAGQYFGGSMSHTHLCIGYSYAPTEFGEVDSTSGIWKIKTSPSVSYGTNGFFLKMEDRTNLDLDSSPNANTFATAGTITATYDNPSNNFCTINPLDNYLAASTFSNGNNTLVTHSGNYSYNTGTMGLSAGLWYWEEKIGSSSSYDMVGIADSPTLSTTGWLGYYTYSYGYRSDTGQVYTGTSGSAYGGTYTTGDIIGVYLDLTANKLYFAKNGTLENSGTGVSITAAASTTHGHYLPGVGEYGSSSAGTYNLNFGNGYFGTTAVTSAVADEGGIGAFEYDPSAGTFDSASKDFRAICTKNIKAYGG